MPALRRAVFVCRVLEQKGSPYLWGGRGQYVDGGTARCFDCSGLVVWALYNMGGPDLRWGVNTDVLWNGLPAVDVPQFGDLVFYGGSAANDVSHVEVWLGDGAVVGASGGDRTTTSVEEARRRGACVKVKANYLERKDFRGFRSVDPLLRGERLQP